MPEVVASLRPLTMADLSAMVALQHVVFHPEFAEGESAFAPKLGAFPAGGWGFFQGNLLVAYVVCHPWRRGAPVPLHATTLTLPEQPDCLYLNDLVVAPAAQGQGLARRLLQQVMMIANNLQLREIVLMAVPGAEGFWEHQGFVAQGQIRYGETLPATYMVCPIR